MLKILQRYVLREVLVPTAMALGILTFLVLTRAMVSLTESDQFTGVVLSLSASVKILGYILPTVLTLTIPMALLVGVLLGIGRLTVDSEIKACRTHGVNLFRIFLPVLVVGASVAAFQTWDSLHFAPRMMARLSSLAEEVAYSQANALTPGAPHPQNFLGHSAVVYFENKDPGTGVMGKVYVSIETAAAGGLDSILSGAKKPAKRPPSSDASATSGTLAQAGPTSATRTAASPGDADSTVKTLILAETGDISSDQHQGHAILTLHDGTVHSLRSRVDPRYSVLEFTTMTLNLAPTGDKGRDVTGWRNKATVAAHTSGEIAEHIAALWHDLPESVRQSPRSEEARLRAEETKLHRRSSVRDKIQEIWYLRSEIYSRISVGLACFAFVLIGVPLAVYIRPSGKAVGITISFALFMVYYGFLYSGVRLVCRGLPIGPFLVFLPIGLLVLLGAVFLYRVVRR